MKLTVSHQALLDAVTTVSRCVPARTTMPVLTGLLLDAAGDELHLAATDLDVTCRTRVAAEVQEAGRSVVPARLLAEIVRRIPEGEVAWEADPERADAVLRWQRSEFRLHGLAADQYPQLPAAPEDAHRIAFSPAALRDTLRHTVFATASEAGGRPILTGVELTLLDGEYRALATDGMRVAFYRTSADRGDWSQGQAFTLPDRGVAEIVRCLDAATEEASLCAHESHLHVAAGPVTLSLRLLEGRFPAILDLVPKQFPSVLQLDGGAFREACERVAVVTDAPDRLHAVILNVGEGEVAILARSPEVGEASESLTAESDGPALEFAVNARLLLEGLRHLGDGPVVAEFSGPLSLARFRRADDPRLVYMQMPVRLN